MGKEQSKPPPDVNLLSSNLIILLGNFHYEAQGPKTVGEKYQIDLFKRFRAESSYPRFHIILVVPFQTRQLGIESFHMDEREDISPIDFYIQNMEKKYQEINRLIENLGKEKVSAARDGLLLSLKSELLFGSAREIDKGKKLRPEERFRGLLKTLKRAKLQKNRKFRYISRKNHSRNPEEDL